MVCALAQVACVVPIGSRSHRCSCSPRVASSSPAPPHFHQDVAFRHRPTQPGAARPRPRPHLGRCAAQAEPAAPGKTKIGWLGLGIMGTAMANNLVKAGYDVTVWNRNPDKSKPLEEAGAKVGKSIAEVVKSCDITMAMVSDPAAAKQVANEVAGCISAGQGYVDGSTIDAESAQQISKQIKAAGAQYLEAPVSGTKQPAEKGQLIFLNGGDKELFDRFAPCLDVMGKAKFYLGAVGQGAKMKLLLNMVMGTMMASLSEALTLAAACDLPSKDVVEALGLGALAAPMFAIKGPSMNERKFPTAFPLKHQKKDLVLACDLGKEVNASMPVAGAAASLYSKANDSGLADEDMSAVLKTVLAESGQK